MWSKEVPALVMDHAIPVNPDIWYSRLARHGFVAGNMMTHNMETDALYAVARDLLDIVFDVILTSQVSASMHTLKFKAVP